MQEWDVKQYEKFEAERIRSSIDLVSRINKKHPQRILDIGCGSGMSTLQLVKRWPGAEVIGVDNSASMLQAAEKLDVSVNWKMKDCDMSLEEFGQFDIIFSNASIQWLTNQEKAIKQWFDRLSEDGTIAVQIPMFQVLEIEKCTKLVSQKKAWGPYFNTMSAPLPSHYEPRAYYNMFCKHAKKIDMWQTDYYHIFESINDIIEFYKSTALRPYLNQFNTSILQEQFLQDLLEEIRPHYKPQIDNKVIFEFKRLFIIATI